MQDDHCPRIQSLRFLKFKIIVLGAPGVGKTSLLQRFQHGDLQVGSSVTLGVTMFGKELQVDGQRVLLDLCDTGGQEVFNSLTEQYIRNADGVLVVFDVSQQSTFNKLVKEDQKTERKEEEGWCKKARDESPQGVFFLIGNKCDLEVRVDEKKLEDYQTRFDGFEMTSAKDGDNVQETFKRLTREMIRRKYKTAGSHGQQSIALHDQHAAQSQSTCCASWA